MWRNGWNRVPLHCRPAPARLPARATTLCRFLARLCALACLLAPRIASAQDLFVSDVATETILRYDARTLAFKGTFVSYEGGPRGYEGLTFGPDRNLYVANNSEGILRFHGDTGKPFGIAGNPDNPTFVAPIPGPNFALDLTFGPDGDLYTVGGTGGTGRYDGVTGAFLGSLTGPLGGGAWAGVALAFGPDGNLYVLRDNGAVLRYNATTGAFMGNFTPAVSEGSPFGGDLLFGPSGDLYVSTLIGETVLRYDGQTGALEQTYPLSDFPVTVHGLADGLALGPGGDLIVAGGISSRIFGVDPVTGALQSEADVPAFMLPSKITLGPAPVAPEPGTGGLLYVGIPLAAFLLRARWRSGAVRECAGVRVAAVTDDEGLTIGRSA